MKFELTSLLAASPWDRIVDRRQAQTSMAGVKKTRCSNIVIGLDKIISLQQDFKI